MSNIVFQAFLGTWSGIGKETTSRKKYIEFEVTIVITGGGIGQEIGTINFKKPSSTAHNYKNNTHCQGAKGKLILLSLSGNTIECETKLDTMTGDCNDASINLTLENRKIRCKWTIVSGNGQKRNFNELLAPITVHSVGTPAVTNDQWSPS